MHDYCIPKADVFQLAIQKSLSPLAPKAREKFVRFLQTKITLKSSFRDKVAEICKSF